MRITHLGHSCLLVETAGQRILIDPGVFSHGFEELTDLSAVLITHTERYDYAVTKDGMPDNLSRSYSSAETTKYFSTANMSVGYETPLSRSLKLQVEPYYQVHIQGFGVGDLPLNSFGINIGVVKDFK